LEIGREEVGSRAEAGRASGGGDGERAVIGVQRHPKNWPTDGFSITQFFSAPKTARVDSEAKTVLFDVFHFVLGCSGSDHDMADFTVTYF
jgi:hypothetical protein